MRTLLGRVTGMRIVAVGALALLTFGAVWAATAGPREALHTRTQAVHQTLDDFGRSTVRLDRIPHLMN